MDSDSLSVARLDFAEWAHPILADILSERYRTLLSAGNRASAVLARTHGRLWRALLRDETAKLAEARRDLLELLRLSSLAPGVLKPIDLLLLEELLDVILTRFMRSPGTAREYSRILLHAASNLTALEFAAAA